MKKILLSVFTLGMLTTSAQTFVSTTPENKNIILEEFTGITCVWCPAGHLIGQQLHDANPNDVFLINIHTGGYASPAGPGTDFNTSFGAAIAGQSNLGGYPAGTVNRHEFAGLQQNGTGTAMSRGEWTAAASQWLLEPSPVNVGIQASIDMATSTLTVDVEVYYTGTQAVTSNMLNIAVVQNNIEGPQTGGASNNPGSMLPNGNYNHNHMLRHMLTGQWGETIANITSGTLYSNTYTWTIPSQISGYPLSPILDPTNFAVVAFVSEGQQEILSGTEVYPNLVFANAYDAYLVSATAKDNICSNISKDIEVLIKNYGNLPLTTLDIEYSINGGVPSIFPWTGNLASGQATTVTLSNYTYTPSFTNTLDVNVLNPNGNTDQNTSNDNATTTFINHSYGSITTGIVSGNATIDVTTDQYATETSWELVDDNGMVVVASGTLTNSSAQPTVNAMLVTGACYTFNMYDSYGDGMYPPNGFEVKDFNGNIIVSNYNFTSSEDKTPFETSGVSAASWDCDLSTGACSDPGTGLGAYSTTTACQTACMVVAASWDCDLSTGACSDPGTGLGAYSTTTACQTACVVVAASWDCDGQGNCSDPGTGNGTYTSLSLCNTTCVSSGPSWDCLGIGNCILSGTGTGQYSTYNTCQTACIASSNPSWNCISPGNCVDPGTGTGIYTSIAACNTACIETAINEEISNLLIYPNPAKNTLTIDGNYTSATIYTVFGKVVLITDYQKNIDVAALSSGIYFININTNNAMTVKKITIAK